MLAILFQSLARLGIIDAIFLAHWKDICTCIQFRSAINHNVVETDFCNFVMLILLILDFQQAAVCVLSTQATCHRDLPKLVSGLGLRKIKRPGSSHIKSDQNPLAW